VSLKKTDGIGQYKLIQENINTPDIQLVKGMDFKEAGTEEFKSVLRKILGEDIQINVNIVDEIPREKSGKIRQIVSKLPASL